MDKVQIILKRPGLISTLKFVHDNEYTSAEEEWMVLPNSLKVWESVFSGSFSNALVQVEGTNIRFIPNPSMQPVVADVGSSARYSLSQFGKVFADMEVVPGKSQITFDVIPRGITYYTYQNYAYAYLLFYKLLEPEMDQLKDLIIEVKSFSNEIQSNLKLDIVCTDSTTGTTRYLCVPCLTWKNDLRAQFLNYSFSCVQSTNEGLTRTILVDLSADEVGKSEEISAVNQEIIATTTFMRFIVTPVIPTQDPVDNPRILPIISTSFKHELTLIGLRTLERLERDLLDRFNGWNLNTKLIAPIVSLCQSSGSGKSKLAFELLKRHLGFYLVFRLTDQTGFPRKNSLSDELYKLVEKYSDPPVSLENKLYSECTIGLILNFFARIITHLIHLFVKGRANGLSVEMVVEELGRKFEDNSNLKDTIIEQQLMDQIYLKFVQKDNETAMEFENKKKGDEKERLEETPSKITVSDVSRYILTILISPVDSFIVINRDERFIYEFCQEISDHLSTFPFLFVIDEAELLSRIEFKDEGADSRSKIIKTGFEALRRAVSYFDECSQIIFLTLGTKSNIIDINPPVVDNSARFRLRKELPKPIILSSNSNILSKEFPIHQLVPSYEMLRNPQLFKFLCTLGHGIWSSLPFDAVVEIAKSKVVNGCEMSKDYVISLWMIRTGMAANPLSVETGTLVANHMATLLDVSDDLRRLIVTYPSEPILAIAARELMKELSGDHLFLKLKNKMEAVNVDKGKVAELFAGMMVLRLIDSTPSFNRRCNNHVDYAVRLRDINVQAPHFKDLWQVGSHVLENQNETKKRSDEVQKSDLEINTLNDELQRLKLASRQNPSLPRSTFQDQINEKEQEIKMKQVLAVSNSLSTKFLGYSVYRVGDVLNRLTKSEVDWSASDIPLRYLNGILNASHFVNLERDEPGFEFSRLYFSANLLPLADNRIPDKSRNVIDKKLLQNGLLRQCGFGLPASYYGSDYILPVGLPNGEFTFISIQVKRAGANNTDDIYKMQSRLHYVKCVDCTKLSGRTCVKCDGENTLKSIYSNSIALLISLDEEGSFNSFKHEISYARNFTKASKDILMNQIHAEQPNLSLFREKSNHFLTPLINNKIALKDDVLLSQCMWDDSKVGLTTLPAGKNQPPIPFVRDGFIHRQFCISTRGWAVFESLFTAFDSSVKIANSIISPEGIFRGFSNREDPDLIRKVLYDTGPTFMQYSEELTMARGIRSRLEALEQEVSYDWTNSGYTFKKAEKLTGNARSSEAEDNL